MISRQHQAIFIHIPKTAGTSIEQKLGLFSEANWGAQDHRTVREVRPLSLRHHGRLLIDGEGMRKHELRRRPLLKELARWPAERPYGPRATREEFASFLKFTVVRNPWARVHSWYQNVMRDSHHQLRPDFATFLRDEGEYAIRPSTWWMSDFDGTTPLDRVVRFERLHDELGEVFDLLGFKDRTLPHLLPSDEKNYRDAYDDDTAALVADRHRDVIDLYGYEF